MIIQDSGTVNQGAPPVARSVIADLPRVAVAAPNAESKPAPEQLSQAVGAINRALQQANQGLEFSFDPDTKMSIVKMVDTSTGQVIRQIPSEEMLAIARAIDQFQQGLLLREKA